MSREIMSKWEFIAYWLDKLGYKELAEKARKIENALKELYGNTVTDGWIESYNRYGKEMNYLYDVGNTVEALKLIRYVARSVSGCVACLEDKYCDVCRFAIKYNAKCGEKGNPHHEFMSKIDELIKAVEVENEILEDDE